MLKYAYIIDSGLTEKQAADAAKTMRERGMEEGEVGTEPRLVMDGSGGVIMTFNLIIASDYAEPAIA